MVIPDSLLDNDLTLLNAALAFASAGFQVVPLTSVPTAASPGKSASKNPGGLLGKDWQRKSSSDPDKLESWFTEGNGSSRTLAELNLRADLYREVPFASLGLGVHAGPKVVIVDIDASDQVPEWAWEELNAAPFQSSSERDERRGHYYFQADPARRYGHTSAIPTAEGMESSCGEIRHGTAIAVSAPSAHEKAALGRRYKWMRTGPVPAMSERMAQWLESKRQQTTWNGVELDVGEASLDSINAFRDSCTTARNPELLDEHLDFMRMQADAKTLHGAWLPGLIDLMQMALAGFVAAADAIDAAGDAFVEMRTDARRAAVGGNVRDEESAMREYVDLLKWAVGKVQAKYAADAESVKYETFLQAETYYSIPMPVGMPAPETYVEPPLPLRGGKRQWYHPKEAVTGDGRILVRNTHVDIATALAEDFSSTHQWVQNGGGGDGEWWAHNDERFVWENGGQKTSVSAYIIQALAQNYAAYDVVDAIRAPRQGLLPDEMDELTKSFGPSHIYYRLTDRPGTHATEIGHITDMLKNRSSVGARREDFDNTGTRIAVANGLLDVKTKGFEPADPIHKTTKRMPVGYVEGAECPKFLAFLESAVMVGGDRAAAAEVMGLIQRYLGAAILGDWSSDSFLVVHGPGGSGKSTVFEDIPRALFGDGTGYWSTISPAVFTRGISDNGRKFELATVAGSRLLTCNEAFEGGSHMDSSFLKGFTDGSVQRAAFKGRDNFSMTPGRLVFMSNTLPKMTSVDSGVARRACFVEFPHGHSASDPTLPTPDEKLFERDIVPELPGILNWVVEGAAEYLRVGLNPPTAVYASTKSSLLDSSEIGTFLQYLRPVSPEDPEVVRTEFLTLKDLHSLYRDWLDMTQARGATATNFMSEREMLSSIRSAYPAIHVPDNRVNVRLDDGRRTKQTAVYGLTASEEMGAFLVLREGAAGAATTGWMGMPVPTSPRTRIGIPDVEEWRGRSLSAMGSALAGGAAE